MTTIEEDRARALEEAAVRFGNAWACGDIAVLDELLSPDYTHHDAFGARLDRAGWLEYAAKRTGRTTRLEFRNVQTRMFGDVALVTGTNVVTGGGARTPTDNADLTLVFTQVWIWKDGRWLREAFQATPVIDSAFD